ncbi:MAG TPA: betaine--homocysteine S-methyltransferase [Anaerolineales bacterium]|nr:betaine--homocysteine S-methyltransferase [Anaerolineales bacterium]
MPTIQDLVDKNGYVITDGAMGTVLFAAGLEQGDPPELWNLKYPDRVADVHQAYLQAGSQIVLTNTFGGTRLRLALHNAQSQVAQANHAAAEILRKVVKQSGKDVIVAGDIGPTGEVLVPYGELAFQDAKDAFKEQASALISGGVDLIWIETMSDLEEVRAAVEGTREVSTNIPIVTTMTFDTHGRTMMGVTPEQAFETLTSFGVEALGGNCGNGPEEIIEVITKMRAIDQETILVAKANAGIPELVQGKAVYRASPETMADYAIQSYQAGARVIGACCGSTPDHIFAIVESLSQHAM